MYTHKPVNLIWRDFLRAIITCTTCINDDNKIKRILEEINWIPKFTDPGISKDSQTRDEFIKMMDTKKGDILTNIPDESKEIINATTICTIYNGETKTWGIVSRPNKFLISFRLKNPLSTRLKAACKSLIISLRFYNGKFLLIRKKEKQKKKQCIKIMQTLN